MSKKIQAKIVNGALIPHEPLGIEEGANVVFVLAAKYPPGVEPDMRDYAGDAETETPGEIAKNMFVEADLEKERQAGANERPQFRVTPHYGKFLLGSDPKKPKQLLDDEDVENYLNSQGGSK